MNETKEPTIAAIDKEKSRTRCDARAPSCRTVLIAASVGVLIGLSLKR